MIIEEWISLDVPEGDKTAKPLHKSLHLVRKVATVCREWRNVLPKIRKLGGSTANAFEGSVDHFHRALELLQHLPGLTELNLNHFTVTEQSLPDILRHAPALEVIRLGKTHHQSLDMTSRMLTRNQSLTSLDLTGASSVVKLLQSDHFFDQMVKKLCTLRLGRRLYNEKSGDSVGYASPTVEKRYWTAGDAPSECQAASQRFGRIVKQAICLRELVLSGCPFKSFVDNRLGAVAVKLQKLVRPLSRARMMKEHV